MIELKEGIEVICNLCGEPVKVKKRTDIVALDIHVDANEKHCRNSASSENHDRKYYEELDTMKKNI